MVLEGSFDDAAFVISNVRGVAKLQQRLHLSQCLIGVGQRSVAHIAVQRLKPLDRPSATSTHFSRATEFIRLSSVSRAMVESGLMKPA
jgi:hypothetical protein